MGRTAAPKKTVSKAPIKKKDVKKVAPKTAKAVPKKAAKKAVTQKRVAKPAPKKTAPKAAKAPRKASKSKVASGPAGYTADEYEKFKNFQQTFAKKSNQ